MKIASLAVEREKRLICFLQKRVKVIIK